MTEPWLGLAVFIVVSTAVDIYRGITIDRRLMTLEVNARALHAQVIANIKSQGEYNHSLYAYTCRTDIRLRELENAVSTLAIKQGLVFGGESVRH